MNRIRPSRLAGPALLALAALSVAACGSTAAAGGASASASPSPSARARNGAAGELVQMNGTTLILSATSGDITVVYDTSTTFQKTSNGSFADVSAGKCIVATGQKDAAGTVTASAVRLTSKVNGTCTVGARPGAGGGFGGGNRTPAPGASPRPTVDFVAGEVTAVTGTSVTVQPAAGAAQAVTIPTTAVVSRSAAVGASDLALHQCIQANGARDASGKVTARAITIVPAGPSGCFTGGRGGFGGFGGGGGRPGGGGAPPAG